jgi:hypothetical protein
VIKHKFKKRKKLLTSNLSSRGFVFSQTSFCPGQAHGHSLINTSTFRQMGSFKEEIFKK